MSENFMVVSWTNCYCTWIRLVSTYKTDQGPVLYISSYVKRILTMKCTTKFWVTLNVLVRGNPWLSTVILWIGYRLVIMECTYSLTKFPAIGNPLRQIFSHSQCLIQSAAIIAWSCLFQYRSRDNSITYIHMPTSKFIHLASYRTQCSNAVTLSSRRNYCQKLTNCWTHLYVFILKLSNNMYLTV